MANFGYLVDLSQVKLDDSSGAPQSWIQAMPLGTYDHPIWGEIKFDDSRVKNFADNVNNNVRGTELDIDYDHKANGGEAAGWVKKAEAIPGQGLYVLVEWTQKAASLIKDKAYRYFSPEFSDTWTHPKTKQEHKDVLFGGGITNRPFLKDILPINLSEVVASASDQNNEGEGMDKELLKKLAARFGLPEDATEDQVMAKVNEAPADPADAGTSTEPPKQEDTPPVAASEDAALKALSESHPAIKKLMDLVTMQGQALTTVTKELGEARTEAAVTKLSEKAREKGYAINPTVQADLKKVLSEDAPKSTDVVSLFEKLLDGGLTELGERRVRQSGGQETGNAIKRFGEAVQAKMKDNNGMEYAEAAVAVASDDPELFAEYQSESYAG